MRGLIIAVVVLVVWPSWLTCCFLNSGGGEVREVRHIKSPNQAVSATELAPAPRAAVPS
jgi:hypothetical protein